MAGLTCRVLQDLLKAVNRSTGLLVRGVLEAVREPPTSRDHCENNERLVEYARSIGYEECVQNPCFMSKRTFQEIGTDLAEQRVLVITTREA